MTRLFHNTGTTFSGFEAAERWLIGLGYSVGPMQANDPVGVHKKDPPGYGRGTGIVRVPKWRNMSALARKLCDGRIVPHGGSGFCDGGALVALDYEPEAEATR